MIFDYFKKRMDTPKLTWKLNFSGDGAQSVSYEIGPYIVVVKKTTKRYDGKWGYALISITHKDDEDGKPKPAPMVVKDQYTNDSFEDIVREAERWVHSNGDRLWRSAI